MRKDQSMTTSLLIRGGQRDTQAPQKRLCIEVQMRNPTSSAYRLAKWFLLKFERYLQKISQQTPILFPYVAGIAHNAYNIYLLPTVLVLDCSIIELNSYETHKLYRLNLLF